MFLKRLTMKGFKSFADSTVLEFEQGVTAVVGPNGSGKSNVVDAVAWVLGAQSARALRSGKMEDVIFMGTANRPALGRAEVTLTLDNSSGKLPVDGAEVTISRILFRSGESEYAINGTTCRLLDIQELLSDSGVGRHQHMIIGQNQLDTILNSRSEDRRAVIEEAAGVLKHRRRKERAERRLAQTQENLERLGDLVREVRRQMRPLERQATAARNYADVAAELKTVRRAAFARTLDAFGARRGELETSLAITSSTERELRAQLASLDAQAAAAAAEVASRREEHLAQTLGVLQGLAERVRGTQGRIGERQNAVKSALDASADESVIATLETDAARAASDLADVDVAEQALAPMRNNVANALEALATAEEDYTKAWGDGVSSDPQVELDGTKQRITLVQRALESARTQAQRVNERLTKARTRVEELTVAITTATSSHAQASADLATRRAEVETAAQHERETDAALNAAQSTLRDLNDTAARTQARAEALARALDEFSGAGGRAILASLDGVLGAFLDLVDVENGWEKAVESAAGASLGAVIVDGRHSARSALAALRAEGGAGLVLPAVDATSATPSAPQGCTPLRNVVTARRDAPAHVTRVLDALFARAFVATDWEAAIDVASAHPDLIIVTRDGDRFAATGWRIASGRAVVTRSSVEEAEGAARLAAAAVEPATATVRELQTKANDARASARERSSALVKAEALVERFAKELERLQSELTEAKNLITTADGEATDADASVSQLEAEATSLSALLPALEVAVADADARAAAADLARTQLEALRRETTALSAELDRSVTELVERRRMITARQEDVERRLAGHTAERAQAADRRESLEFDLSALERMSAIVAKLGEDVQLNQDAFETTYREQLEASRASAEQLETLRQERNATEARLTQENDNARKHEVEAAELSVKITTLHETIRRDLGIEPEQLGLVEAPELPEGVTLEQRLAELEVRINSLGPINPLALEELTTLESRYQDLDAQVADVRHARRELQEVVRALDEEIMTTFSSAMADVNEHFSTLIGMLFPGGQGRLTLTEPEDLLNTGVEIEVRPMGRNVRRVSLLSGGERSMAALAFLFSVFRSRPSPFYMMDEVEAALDDVNLQRFLSLVAEFRDEAQLLIVTHQKRTMEAADALYGVTMVPGASSKVVSQRVKRDQAPTA